MQLVSHVLEFMNVIHLSSVAVFVNPFRAMSSVDEESGGPLCMDWDAFV